MTAITLLSACGTLRKSAHTDEVKSIASSSVQTVSTKTVTEKADTTVKTKADSVRTSGTLEAIKQGDTLRAETDKTEVKVFYDTDARKIVAEAKSKPQDVHVLIDKTTVSEVKTNNVETSEQSRKVRDVDKERKGGSVSFLWGVISMLILLIILFVLYRYIKSMT